MTLHAKAHHALDEIRRHGFAHTAHTATLKAVNAAITFKLLRCVVCTTPDGRFLQCPDHYTATFLLEDTIRRVADDPDHGMPNAFVDEALAKGDDCFAICDGPTLAAYGWYALRPTRIVPRGLLLRVSPQYVYMYNGLTHPRYRGQRLHAIGMTMALQHYLNRGFRGLVSYVESDNFDSLKSVFRMGYVQFGSVFVLNAFGRYFIRATPSCERFGLRVEVAPGAPDLRR